MPFSHVRPDSPEQIALKLVQQAESDRVRQGGEHYKPLKWLAEYPGVEQPRLSQAGDVTLPESTQVVGIEVDGDAFAFVLDSMLEPTRHIANLCVGGTAVSVTYCNLVDCVRVLTDHSAAPIPLHVGGLDVDDQMVLLLNGQRYGQLSAGLPLTDYPFRRMNFSQWKTLHPNTKVYVAPST